MKKLLNALIITLLVFKFFTSCEKESGLPADGDGNEYDTVHIGDQIWLKENLKTTKLTNGVDIDLVSDNLAWEKLSEPAFCWYENDPDYKNQYGALYSWRAAKYSMLCPTGWHTSTIEDWNTLIDYLGGEEVAGDRLKDMSGFAALPGGYRSWDGMFLSVDYSCVWLAYTPGTNSYALYIINKSDSKIDNLRVPKEGGFSIRCVKNNW